MMELRTLLCCFALLFIGASVADIETLHDIKDLKGIEFGHEYPRHGLLLLHWLASHVTIDQAEALLLHFDPLRQDYGFQHYENPLCTEEFGLPHLNDPLDREYYSLGSLSSEAVRTQLPPYVTQDYYNSLDNPNRDLDLIILRVQKTRPMIADKVYVTSIQGCDYNQNKTHEISSKLLRQVQALKKPVNILLTLLSDSWVPNITQSDDPRLALTKGEIVTHLQNIEKHLKSIFEQQDVRWLLSLAGYDLEARFYIHKQTWLCSTDEPAQYEESNPKTACEGHIPVKIEVKSTPDGYARLMWSGIPNNIIEQGPTIVLFSSDTSSMLETFESLKGQTSGSADTFVALKHGLHPRLVTYKFGSEHGFFGLRYTVYWRGPQFDATNRVIPTEINGYNASLQLYTKDGYACARLYIKNSFTDWKQEFYNSWVGFYASERDLDHKYQHYQWVSNFEKVEEDDDTKEYLIYQYQSNMSIGPGVQARFLFSKEAVRTFVLLRWYTPTVKARTVPWEKVKT
ncbi:uncharacterized protein LOC108441702 [Pygocentrus nattereri]|uniref:uncharacterized protein LOC108441702 n=1 Tax=Pygocentrus nattereri TaxID=42514 RepID=UPI0008147DDB|nr:uncharacterized protein LOC108441702 [Pygocentrus nattereri]